MNEKSKQTSQKLRGGYYTPQRLAMFLSNWVVQEGNVFSILEPSAGDGSFINCLINIKKKLNVTAIEIIEEESNKILSKTKANDNFKVINTDFYNFYESYISENSVKYDAVLGNPPYIRYQYLSEDQREFQSKILKKNNIKPNKLINSWVAFTVASIEMLSDGGKIAFILPTDLLQVSYAKQLRQFLFENLSYLTIMTFDELIFNDIQQDVIVLLGVKKERKLNKCVDHNLRVINLKNIDCLNSDLYNIPFKKYTQYDADKWTKFYLTNKQRNFYEGDFIDSTNEFNKYATGEVGVTTGNNSFFVITDKVAKSYFIKDYTRPVLGRSVEVRGVFYTQEDLLLNTKSNQKVWMLDFNGKKLNQKAKKYIKYGEENKDNIGYKLSLRTRWYDIPSIWVPDAFLLRRIGEFPRIIKNESGATSTDTFHRIKFNPKINISKFLFLMYSSPTLLSFELEGRVFGGGALEILPGDLKNIRIPKVNNSLNFPALLEELDEKLRMGESITDIVLWVDKTIKKASVFSNKQLSDTFIMWKALNKKRMGS